MFANKAVFLGVGGYLPDNIVSNEDLSRIIDTNDEWIVSRTGIRQRHFVKSGEFTSDLATKAAVVALQAAKILPQDVDLIVLATATGDRTFPATATQVQANLGISGGYAYDVAGVCCGYLLALQCANNAIKCGDAKTALVIGAETFSRILNFQDRKTCVLFGDGAGAVVLQAAGQDAASGVIDICLESNGSSGGLLRTSGGPSVNNGTSFVEMDGREVYKQAVLLLTQASEKILAKNNLSIDDVDWVIPHQANIRIIDHVCKKLRVPAEKVITTVQDHANTSAASIPLALWQAAKEGKLKEGDLILHQAIGGGLIWGAALVRC